MNDRKRAWQILHNEIRRRADERGPSEIYARQVGAIMREADDLFDVALELAGFGATFALYGRDPEMAAEMADRIGAAVIQEPDSRTAKDLERTDSFFSPMMCLLPRQSRRGLRGLRRLRELARTTNSPGQRSDRGCLLSAAV